jgi:tetratricopeptide (TPR) repeat protein
VHQGNVIAGRFVAERRVGEGGGGVVWRAADRLTGATIALKLLLVENPESMERFAREAGALASLHHPTIVRYVAHGLTEDGQSYLATEWLEGETLTERLQRGALDVPESVAIARHIAEALGVAHAHDIVHRDVKPSNVVLRGRDVQQATLIDFGVAHLGIITSLVTQPGSLLGTPSYMSPEQACGAADIDARSDVFGLGCLLFECLTGRPPFGRGDALAVLGKVVLQQAPRVRELAPHVPREVDDLVARMLAKSPSGRPSDGAAVAAALRTMVQPGSHTGVPPPEPSRPDALTRAELGIVSITIVGVRRARPDDDTRVGAGPEGRDIDRLRAAALTLGGRLEPLLDGSCVAAFAGRGNATDQATLAARFALAARLLSPASPVALATGRGLLSDGAVLGEAIDRAVHLVRQARATHPPPQGVLLDETSAAFLDGRFDVVQAPDLALLTGERAVDEPVRTLRGKPTACVGRERELESLARTLDECIAEPAARVVVVTGPAGVGKSRLRYELLRSLRGRPEIEVLIGRGDTVGAGSPFAMIGQAIRRAIGMLDGEPAATSQRKLEARVSRHVPAGDRPRVAAFLGELLGIRFPDDANEPLRIARRDPTVMSDQMKCAWEDWLLAECRHHPLLIVLEDMQWGDAPSVAYLDDALRVLADLPLMVLALGRQELSEHFPTLWDERHVDPMRLWPLGKRAAERLAREVLGDGVDDATVTSIVERASGNALYLEELIRAVAEGERDALPKTVLAMVQARLERIEPAARHVLRAASVFGDAFWDGGVRALIGASEASTTLGSLELLVRQELISVRRQARFPDEREYVFRHSIVREGAYAMLTDNDRAVGHQLAAAWLEAKGESDAALLADHFDHGGERTLAARWNVRAAKQALDANDVQAAVSRADRAEAQGASGALLGQLRTVQAAAQTWHGATVEAIALAEDAMKLLPEGSADWCSAASYVVHEAGQAGDIDRVEAVADALVAVRGDDATTGACAAALASASIHLRMAGRIERANALSRVADELAARGTEDDFFLRAQMGSMHVLEASADGDLHRCVHELAASVAAFDRAGALRKACAARNDLGDTYMQLGLWEQAEATLRDLIATCERLGVRTTHRLAQGNLALVMARRGRLDEARALCSEALDAFHTSHNPRLEGGVRTYYAIILALAGDLDGGAREARAAYTTLAVAPPLRPLTLATLARIELARGHVEPAMAAAREAMDLLAALGPLPEGDDVARLAWAEALEAAGRTGQAREAIGAARDALLARAAKIQNDDMQKSFLAIPEHARILALAGETG